MDTCLAHSGFEERISALEKTSDLKDEENEKAIQNVSNRMSDLEAGVEKFKKDIKKDIAAVDKKVDTLRSDMPEIVETAFSSWIRTGIGKAFLFILRSILVTGVIGGIAGGIAWAIKTFIFG